ncbi:tRNA pseudouridine synthase family protein [Trichomonas vaginalis G3]|uniref:tRNA pseudouridylate synthase 2 n=1 Tax=Trichomonas vaginalis (strain ATCC PRA-98 / G3) TaxID=412133 RepID=A2DE30_TRIV3|nr:pseudouridine synthase protein [Trichomonas vaginalis G3]EAY21248.1 tRNA pseudouridine synthase family protein [Trichomonas vaginalis G3]KAI5548808.1 pseudouridine synthase protein [Trichomonas vaginalis G3]|eukprot:XP_001582234.1 tRNA pseudouridine synthase family protein [Trichomonas vaginalis G3]
MGIFSSSPKYKKLDVPRSKYVFDLDEEIIILLYRYIGTQYHGLQQNIDTHTVEKELFQALISAGFLSDQANCNLNRIKWSEASRTDAGVHACAQVLSFKASGLKGICIADIPDLINKQLPRTSDIEIITCITLRRQFYAQKFAESRNYNFLLPTNAFSSNSIEHLNYLRTSILPLFIGWLNYHNFTSNKSASNPSSMRKIDVFTFTDPFEVEGVEFVLFTIHGESFMLNQIRKMIATVISASHNYIGAEEVKRCLSEEGWSIKMCPGDGLMLDHVDYIKCNKPSKKNPITFENDLQFTEFQPEIQRWKKEVLFPHIAEIIKKKDLYHKWVIEYLPKYPWKPIAEQ